ncbi:microfibril-associated glycoprotein 4-like [Anopheles funestus]|uniref:microfibril-associated glycoprotein 4-like n=1 Tax=Anopheles funestus TaxID=62324 RepID=UPI0020C5CE6D|nr:microfibril-associated glycoprotein 4-like [Anopheles funestus]
MTYWSIVLLTLCVGVVVTHYPPDNPPYLLDEATARTESRILERIEHLSRILSNTTKVFNDRVDEVKRDFSSVFLALNETKSSCRQSISQMKNETTEMFNATNRALGHISEQLSQFSTLTTHGMINLEHKLERRPEDTGVYLIRPDASSNRTFEVSRDWTNNHEFGGNWIVFQRRFNGSVNFYRNWTEYKDGFGDLHGEHWLGLDKLHAILKPHQHELLVVLEDFDGVIAYAHYANFKIGDEGEKYVIQSVGKYTGTAGDSFTTHGNTTFSTYDQDNDEFFSNCAKSYDGAWWFHRCYERYWISNTKYSSSVIFTTY